MKKRFTLDLILTLLLGFIAAILGLLLQFLTDGDYRYALIANMLLFAISGSILKQKLNRVPVLVGILLLTFPYGIYYYTQIKATPLISIFQVFNMLAVIIGIYFNWKTSRARNITKIIGFVFSIFLTGWLVIPFFSINSGKTITNTKAPVFEVSDMDGNLLNSKELEGKIIIVDFWATWCKPCIAEIIELEKFYDQIRDSKDIVLLVINEDNGGDIELTQKFINKRSLDVPFYVDNSSSAYNAFDAYSFPALYLIDDKGNIRWMSMAYNPSDNLTSKLLAKINKIKTE